MIKCGWQIVLICKQNLSFKLKMKGIKKYENFNKKWNNY